MEYQKMPAIQDIVEIGDLRRIKNCNDPKVRFVLQNRKLKELSISVEEFSKVLHLEFDLSYNKTLDHAALFETLSALTNLKGLGLIKNEMKELPDSIGNLKALETLELWSNGLKSLPKTFSALTQLRYLNLRNNSLNSFPELLGNLKNLYYLNLRFNKIKTVSATLYELANLEELDLSSCGLTAVPEGISKLKNLKVLELESNDIKTLPADIVNLPNLETIHLKGNKNIDLELVCSLLAKMPGIKKLSFNGWGLSQLPTSLGDMLQLESLDLEDNKLKRLPDSLKKLKNLREIKLQKNEKLDPDSYFEILSALPEIKEFNLYQTSLFKDENSPCSLPDRLGDLKFIEKLSLHYARGLVSIPETLGNLTQLKELEISSTEITSLPSSIGNLKNLKRLIISDNKKLSSIPRSFYQLSSLVELYFHGIEPDFSKISEFKHLEYLSVDNIDNNALTFLKDLPVLKTLTWRNEELVHFPDAFFRLPAIQKIEFSHFPNIDLDVVMGKLTSMTSIKEIHFDFRRHQPLSWYIEKLPKFQHLEKAYIITNDRVIPASITQLSFIKELTIDIHSVYSDYSDLELPLELATIPVDRIKFTRYSKALKTAKEAIEKINTLNIQSEREQMIAFALLTGRYKPLSDLIGNPFRKEQKLMEAVVYISGKPTLGTLKELKDELVNKGAKVKTKPGEVTHILLTPNINEQDIGQIFNKGYTYILEDHLKEHLIEEDTPYLLVEDNAELVTQITRLLKSKEEENLSLILQIVEGGGANRLIISYLLAIHLFHNDNEIRKKSRNLFKKFASSDLQNHVKNTWKDSLKDKELDGLKKVYHHKEIDIFAFILAFKMVRWHQAGKKGQINEYRFGQISLERIGPEEITPSISECDFMHSLRMQMSKPVSEQYLFDKIKNLPLKSLTLEQSLEVFPVSFLEIPTLETLSINSWQVPSRMRIPQIKNEKVKLQELNISYQELTDVENLKPLSSLKRLTLNFTTLTELAFLESFTQLTFLNLSNNHLAAIPQFLEKFSLLETLYFGDNPLKNINLQFGRLQKLKSLSLSKCGLTSLPDTFTGCASLQDVYIHQNELTELPVSLFAASADTYSRLSINASENKISQIGEIKEARPSIFSLFGKNKENQYDFASHCMGRINLQKNQLREIPAFFFGFKEIREIDLKDNPIQLIPAEFSQLKVGSIMLTGTEISEIPINIFFSKASYISISTSSENLRLPPEEDIPAHKPTIYINAQGEIQEKVEKFMKVVREKQEKRSNEY